MCGSGWHCRCQEACGPAQIPRSPACWLTIVAASLCALPARFSAKKLATGTDLPPRSRAHCQRGLQVQWRFVNRAVSARRGEWSRHECQEEGKPPARQAVHARSAPAAPQGRCS